MADGQAAYDPDRLPWLADTRRARRSSGSTSLVLWALLATLLVAGVSYWMGMESAREPDAFPDFADRSSPMATVRLPEPAIRQVQPPALPPVQPVAEPAPVKIPLLDRAQPATAKSIRRGSAKLKARTAPRKARARPAPVRKQTVARDPARLQAWPAAVSQGAYGRVARIGMFSSRRQAKKGWWTIVRHYPGMRRLKAVVAPVRWPSNGRVYYRLQFGTTSQAHSEVLCQRVRVIGQSCVVVGLPAGQRGGRR